MPWSPAQRRRLVLEKNRLNKYFSGKVKWIDQHTDNIKVEVTVSTNSNQSYCLRVYVPRDFPNSVPQLVVRHSQKPMPNWGLSGTTHTLTRRDGYLRFCYYDPAHWGASHYFEEIFLKGLVWLEAYGSSVSTGKKMNYFLRNGHVPV